MTRRIMTLAALLAMMMVGAVAPATAQVDSTPESEASPAAGLSGIAEPDAIYGRFYLADTDALIAEATPEADTAALPPLVAITQVYEFASADDAEAAVEPLNQLLNEQIGATDVQTESVEDMGDKTSRSQSTIEESGFEAALTSLTTQQDNVVFVSVVGTFDDSSGDIATNLIEHMLDAEPGDTEVMFNADGTSTGGYFDVFPTDGDELIQGLVVSEDMYIGVETIDATPTS